jgi:hypothetical protein
VSATLERCVQAKDEIVCYYADIKKQIREGDELCKAQSSQLKNKVECCRQQGLSEFILSELYSLYLIKIGCVLILRAGIAQSVQRLAVG